MITYEQLQQQSEIENDNNWLGTFAELPQIGDEYEFDYYVGDIKFSVGRLKVVDVTDEHIMYKLFNDDGTITQRSPHPITHEVWKANTDERRKVEAIEEAE